MGIAVGEGFAERVVRGLTKLLLRSFTCCLSAAAVAAQLLLFTNMLAAYAIAAHCASRFSRYPSCLLLLQHFVPVGSIYHTKCLMLRRRRFLLTALLAAGSSQCGAAAPGWNGVRR